MKVALFFAGQLRSVAKAFPYYEKNLLSKHDVDVFFNYWQPKEEEYSIVEDAIRLYKPKRYSGQAEINSAYFDRYTRIAHPQWPARNLYHQAYSVFKANMLKKEQELRQGFDYDIVVRSRFDYALNRELPLDQVEPGKVYIPADNQRPERDYGHDGFGFGTSKVMDRYSMTLLNIDLLYDQFGVIMNNEEMFAGNLRLNGLIGENLVYVDMNNPFPPDKYGSMWHSFIRDDFARWNPLRG